MNGAGEKSASGAPEKDGDVERLFRAVFDSALDAMILADDDGRIVDANEAAAKLFARPREELLASTTTELLATFEPEASRALWHSFRVAGSQRGLIAIARADGSRRDVEYVATADVVPGRHLSVLRDMTAERRTDATLRFLAEASTTLAASLDHERTLRNVARLAVPALADWAVIDVIGKDGSLLRVAVEHVDAEKVALAHEYERRRPLRPDDPFGPANVIRTGAPEVAYEVADEQIDAMVPDAEMREIIHSLGLRSTMCVPLRARERVVGALSLVFADSNRRYGPPDLELAEELARRIAVALDNAYLYAEAQAARALADGATARAQLLADASRLLETMQDADATLAAAAKFVVPALADWCFADRLDEDGTLRRVAVVHIDPGDAELAARIGLHTSRPAAELDGVGMLRSAEPQLFEEIDDAMLRRLARDDAHLAALRDLAPRAALVLPLAARGRIFGTLLLARCRDARSFTREDVLLCEELARRAAIAADNARLYRAMQKAEARARFLAEASVALASSLDFEAVLPKIVRLVVPGIADAVGVYRVAPDGSLRQIAVAHRDPEREPLIRELHALSPLHVDQDRVLPNAIRSGRSQLLSDIPAPVQSGWGTGDRVREIVTLLALRSYMAVPIEVRGRVLGAIALSSSESGRRFDETDLAIAEELARRLASALENAQLYSDAREASRLKDEFLATISHELRTPLNAILGWASILPSRATDPAAFQRGLAVIERNARAQARLIDDVLDVSRIISGKLALRRERVEIDSVIRAAVESIAPSAATAKIDLRVEVPPDVGAIVGDSDRVQQIVWNLLSNAVKFTPAGGHVAVTATRSAEHVVIAVADDGAGIAAEFLPFVFDRFRQADSSMTRRHGGLGLGLAIARHLSELHGGRIEVESAGVGRGATFRVVLPARAVPDALPESAPPPPTAARVATPRLEGLRVLVCDDDPDAREIVMEILRAAGAHVESSASAAEALAAIDASPPDVLISDIGMPDEDGYALMRQLRARPPERGGSVPAVALTAYARAVDRRRALEAGYHQHVPKPVQASDLLVVVANLAGRFAS